MTTITKIRNKNLVASIERGLDRMMTSPTARVRRIRQEIEREESVRQHQFETTSREYLETLKMVRCYLLSLPS